MSGTVIALLVFGGLGLLAWRSNEISMKMVNNLILMVLATAAGIFLLVTAAEPIEIVAGLVCLGYALYGLNHTIPLWQARSTPALPSAMAATGSTARGGAAAVELPAQTLADTGIDCRRLSVIDGHGVCSDLDLEVTETDSGEMFVRSTDADERTWKTIEASDLQLAVVVPAAELKSGDVAAPAGMIDGTPIATRTLAAGQGVLVLTDQRALGLVFESDVEAESLAAAVDDDGSGSVLVFAVPRMRLNGADVRAKWLGGGVDSVTLHGTCFVSFSPERVLGRRQQWRVSERREIEGVIRSFVGGEPLAKAK